MGGRGSGSRMTSSGNTRGNGSIDELSFSGGMTPVQNQQFMNQLNDLGYSKSDAVYQLREFADDFDGLDDDMANTLRNLASKLDAGTLTAAEAREIIQQLEV